MTSNRKVISLGDNRVKTTGPVRGYVYVKSVPSSGGGAFKNGEWMKSDGTFDLTQKSVVDGNVS
jgi:hypothetical protein